MQATSVELKRDCAAVQIPAGTTVTLPAGTVVDITQTLGGSYTVHAPGGLFRLAPQDADALGLERPSAPPIAMVPPPMICPVPYRTKFANGAASC